MKSFISKLLFALGVVALAKLLGADGAILLAAAPYTTGFLGMRGTGDFSSDERPQNWREMILKLFPTGAAPLTAIMSKLRSERTTDPQFNWFQKELAAQAGAVTNIYIDDLSTAYVYASHQSTYGIVGQTLYVKVAEATANHFRAGHQVVLIDSNRSDVDVTAYVNSVTKAGANSKLVVTLLEADDNSSVSASYNLATVDYVKIAGNAQPEGANLPDSVVYDPSPLYNYTQIMMTTLSITRTAKKTRLRSADAYQEAKMEALQYHSIESERAFLFGERLSTTGANNKPLRFTRGILHWIKSDTDAVNSDFRIDSSYSGDTWEQSGEDWIDDNLETLFRWNDQKVLMGLCGSGFLRGVQKIAKASGQINLQPMSSAYGLQIKEWVTPFGTIALMTHPLFNFEATDRYRMISGDPRRLAYRYIDDVMFMKDPGEKVAGYTKRDATDEAYLSEAGLELHHAKSFASFNGGGQNNVV